MKDFREENPKLHRLHVIYAQEDLQIINAVLEQFNAVSRVNMNIIGGMIWQERAKLLQEDAAYQEAAWRLQADCLLLPEPEPEPEPDTALGK